MRTDRYENWLNSQIDARRKPKAHKRPRVANVHVHSPVSRVRVIRFECGPASFDFAGAIARALDSMRP